MDFDALMVLMTINVVVTLLIWNRGNILNKDSKIIIFYHIKKKLPPKDKMLLVYDKYGGVGIGILKNINKKIEKINNKETEIYDLDWDCISTFDFTDIKYWTELPVKI